LSDDIAIEELTEQDTSLERFIEQFIDYWDQSIETSFPKKSDQQLAAAIIELFRRKDNIELFNKKALYIYIREMSDANTQQITRMLKTMKDKYKEMYKDYLILGFLPKTKTY